MLFEFVPVFFYKNKLYKKINFGGPKVKNMVRILKFKLKFISLPLLNKIQNKKTMTQQHSLLRTSSKHLKTSNQKKLKTW